MHSDRRRVHSTVKLHRIEVEEDGDGGHAMADSVV